METILIEIRNPKAKRLLLDLAELDLIALRPTPQQRWQTMNSQLPDVPEPELPEEEIEAEIRAVRQNRPAAA